MTNRHLKTLREIYRLYENQIENAAIVCRKYCSDCCSTSVTMTRLEGLLVLDAVSKKIVPDPISGLSGNIFPRFQPRLSTNAYVASCRTATDNPGDDNPGVQTGTCPFLENKACTIYPVRPFGCRCMVSKMKCDEKGVAEIDDYTLTLNTVFLQFIEHLDQNGYFGNMLDVLIYLSSGNEKIPESCIVISNHPIPALMVPPAHRGRIADLINTLDHLIRNS